MSTHALTLSQAVWPRATVWRDATLVVGFSILNALAAQVRIDLPFSPVPITGQTFAVLLSGMLLGSRLGSLALLAYLGEGLIGLPVFAGGTSAWGPTRVPGVPVIVGPTAGYLVGFVLAAYVTGLLAERGWDRHPWATALAMVVGNLVIYGFGVVWLVRFVPPEAAIGAGVLPFLAGDALKLMLAAALLPAGWRLVRGGR